MKASTVTTARVKLIHGIWDNRVAILVWAIEALFGHLHSQLIYMYVSYTCTCAQMKLYICTCMLCFSRCVNAHMNIQS